MRARIRALERALVKERAELAVVPIIDQYVEEWPDVEKAEEAEYSEDSDNPENAEYSENLEPSDDPAAPNDTEALTDEAEEAVSNQDRKKTPDPLDFVQALSRVIYLPTFGKAISYLTECIWQRTPPDRLRLFRTLLPANILPNASPEFSTSR